MQITIKHIKEIYNSQLSELMFKHLKHLHIWLMIRAGQLAADMARFSVVQTM